MDFIVILLMVYIAIASVWVWCMINHIHELESSLQKMNETLFELVLCSMDLMDESISEHGYKIDSIESDMRDISLRLDRMEDDGK